MSAFPSYSVGTVSVKKGDTIIVGAGGPLWTSTANARAGDDIIIAGHIWPLLDVIDAIDLAIDPWPFDDVPAGTPYKILQRSPLRFAGGQAAADVTQLVGALNTEGLFRIVAGAAAPDPSVGEENQFALQPSTFKLWLKTGGQWVFQGIFKGFRVRGPYSSTAAYLTNDIVSQDGASHVALVDNTGQPVTNAAAWALFAAKGDTGAHGPQGAPGSNGTDGTNGANGAGYAATSTTSLTIGTGSQTFATQAGLAYSAGARARASNGANSMEGLVTAYSGTSLTINVTRTGGSGTFASWNINLAGDPGVGNGDMLAANNLSDLTNKDAALTNLGGTTIGKAVFKAASALDAQKALADASMVDKFRGGRLSDELFTLPNGVNEFDLIKVAGIYYFAQDDKTTTQLRSASTIAGLATATATAPVATLRFPTIQFDGTTWHLWGQQLAENKVHHFTAPAFAGPYTDIDQMTTYGDVSVRRFSNGKWYMGYLDGRDSSRPAGVLVAESPNGPWTNLGKFFADIGRSPTHTGEEDDLCVWEADGRVYLTFSAFDGIDQTKGQLPNITELDPNTFRAKAQSVNLVNPTQAWQQRNNQFKLFNPVFLREDAAPDRIYYSHNVSTTGVAAGWGYIEVGTPPTDNRRDLQSLNVDFRVANLDLATGRIPIIHGTATRDSTGLVLPAATGGAFGIPNIPNLDDFAICIDFTANLLPAAGAFNILFRLSKRTEDANFIGLWITTSASGVTTIASQVGTTGVASWTTALTVGVRYRVVLTRQNGNILGYLNGIDEFAAVNAATLAGLQEWAVGNRLGVTDSATQQLNGTIRKVVVVSGKLFAADFSA